MTGSLTAADSRLKKKEKGLAEDERLGTRLVISQTKKRRARGFFFVSFIQISDSIVEMVDTMQAVSKSPGNTLKTRERRNRFFSFWRGKK